MSRATLRKIVSALGGKLEVITRFKGTHVGRVITSKTLKCDSQSDQSDRNLCEAHPPTLSRLIADRLSDREAAKRRSF